MRSGSGKRKFLLKEKKARKKYAYERGEKKKAVNSYSLLLFQAPFI
jgi:hypothetical protein